MNLTTKKHRISPEIIRTHHLIKFPNIDIIIRPLEIIYPEKLKTEDSRHDY